MKRFAWLAGRKKTAPELPYEPPVWFGNKSNGECFVPATRRDRLTRKLILEKAAENARRLGMDRRQFLASSMGMTTSLWVMNVVSACSAKEENGGGGKGDPDAAFCVPEEAMYDETCANGVISGSEFIFDVQTHWFNRDDLANWSAYQNAFGPLFAIATEDAYINAMFCNSDTSVAALTAWPGVSCTATRRIGCGLPLSNDNMTASRKKINELAGSSQRVVNHIQVLPQDPSGVAVQLQIMEEFACAEKVAAWKMYPGFKPGWRLDHDVAEQVIRRGLELGTNLFCIHKGLPIGNFFDVTNNYPDDVGPAAQKFKDANFVIYHSAICAGSEACGGAAPEGAYDPDSARPGGVNALIRSVLDAGITPGSNVYGECGTAYNNIKNDPVVSAHFFGKLLKYLGEENVVWGTDSIINGSPQSQIETFRALEIPESMRAEHGYPALGPSTPEGRLNQQRILGLNAAKLYGVDVERQRCLVESCPLTSIKRELDQELGPRRDVFDAPSGPKNYEEWLAGAAEMERTRRPG